MKKDKSHPAYQLLLSASDRLIKQMETPKKFLLFLTDASNWMHYTLTQMEKYDRDEDHHYTLLLFIEQVAEPWFAGGPKVIENMADGFLEIMSYCEAEGVRDMNNSLLCSFGKYSEGSSWTTASILDIMKSISALAEACNSMEDYEISVNAADLLRAA